MRKGERRTTTFQRHEHDLGLLLRHEDSYSDVALFAIHITLVLDMSDALLREVVGNKREASSPLGDNEDLFEVVSLIRYLPMQASSPSHRVSP